MVAEDLEQKEMTIRVTYPNNPDYEYFTGMETIDLDKEAENDIKDGTGFVISSPRKSSMKKDLINPNGIYSPKFGQRLGDLNPYANRYSCECGYTTSRIRNGNKCPICGKVCQFVDDNFQLFGWCILKDKYHVIHPKFYDKLDIIFGGSPYDIDRKKKKSYMEKDKKKRCSKLRNMLNYSPDIDINGYMHPCSFKPDNEPFFGIGMMEFYERFDEIFDYYAAKNPKKIDHINEIRKDRDIVFCHSIPVFTTHLRPSDIKDGYMYYEPCNEFYTIISKHVYSINNDKRKMNQDINVKNKELFKVQMAFMNLSDEIIEILSGKKGQMRMLVGGRYNFSCRAVIRQNSQLRIDQVLLPYVELVKCLQQRIINILMRTYNISPAVAYDIWSRALTKKDERVAEIINTIIRSDPSGEGLPVIINRNPTINYGSILQVYCIGFTDTLTMSVSLQVLKLLAADFDGDVLNIFHIINNAFYKRCLQVFNPRNCMYISKVDGMLNTDVMVQRDTIINANTLLHLGRHNYNEARLERIRRLKQRQKEYFSM